MKKTFLTFLFLVALYKTLAQTIITNEVAPIRYYLYGGISANAYNGDLSGYERWGAMFHIGLQNHKKKWISPKFELAYGTIAGQNLTYTSANNPNFFFQTDLLMVIANLQLNIYKTNSFLLYISQGLGLNKFWVKDKNSQSLENQVTTRELGEEYSTISLLLPTKVGVNYFFPHQFGIGFEAGLLNPQTDYLDNISKWGNQNNNDNILNFKFSFYAPLLRVKEKKNGM